jgi:hypothetical protein
MGRTEREMGRASERIKGAGEGRLEESRGKLRRNHE